MNGVFGKYGVKAGGGPAFRKRISTASTSVYLQQQDTPASSYSCSCTTCTSYTTNLTYSSQAACCTAYNGSSTCSCSTPSVCSSGGYYFACTSTLWKRYTKSTYSCCSTCWQYLASNASGWYNVETCTAATPTAASGTKKVECQNANVVEYSAWSEWFDADECTAEGATYVDGHIQVECQAA